MAISHICLNCAKDLARQPALLDPHYSLPIVICPDCSKASLRRPAFYSAKYKSLLRYITVFFTLLGQIFFIAGLTIASVNWIFQICEVAIDFIDVQQSQVRITNLLIALTVISIITGTWLTVGFSHIPRINAWLIWLSFLVVVSTIILFINIISKLSNNSEIGLVTFIAILIPVCIMSMIPNTAIMICALVGIPIGKFILFLHNIHVRDRWRSRKRRRKLRRTK